MKRFLPVFELTVAQQRTILVVLLALTAFFAIKHHRERTLEERSIESSLVQPSPSPGTRP